MSDRVVHFEIPFDDADRARAFYSEAFGWEMMVWPESGGYTLASTGPNGEQGPTEPGFINGGLFARHDEYTGPNIVLDVSNLEEALERVKGSGGSVVAEREPVGDMGFTAYVRDTEGNMVGLWETAARG
jgi:uncharacterized protein